MNAAYFQLSEDLFFDLLHLDSDDVRIRNISMDAYRPGTIVVLVEGGRFPSVKYGQPAKAITPIATKNEDGSISTDWNLEVSIG